LAIISKRKWKLILAGAKLHLKSDQKQKENQSVYEKAAVDNI
jgi:hypothetical protein